MVSWCMKSINMKKEARRVKIKRSHLCKAHTQISEEEIAADMRPHIFISCHETQPCAICLIVLILEELLKRRFIKLFFIVIFS